MSYRCGKCNMWQAEGDCQYVPDEWIRYNTIPPDVIGKVHMSFGNGWSGWQAFGTGVCESCFAKFKKKLDKQLAVIESSKQLLSDRRSWWARLLDYWRA